VRDRSLAERARCHAALGDPVRLAIVEDLASTDRTSMELQQRSGLASNLLAYHLDVLEEAALITRCQSSGDRRRRYICLRRRALPQRVTQRAAVPESALFICTENSARSPLAAALWRQVTERPATSAGTHPAARIHRAAVAAGRRAGLDLTTAGPRHLDQVATLPELVVTVCDRAHEELNPGRGWLHWSLPDPVDAGTGAAFDATVRELRDRITTLTETAA
jgi:ArsR family transcriptional regulator, arsenate/arsenite/antimonite-responsive transcriptional repressor / arsenate reductase (thioredoxin)